MLIGLFRLQILFMGEYSDMYKSVCFTAKNVHQGILSTLIPR